MKEHASKRFRRTARAVRSPNMLSDILNPVRSHTADFRRIGPNAMARLVAEGLFEKLPDDELGRPQYQITTLGRARLRALEDK